MTSTRPTSEEYFEYYETYVSKVPDGNIIEQLQNQIGEIERLIVAVSDAEADQIHPPYTWSIKQVVGHMIDAERIFADRLHKFAMGEHQDQPGMDQNVYIAAADYSRVALSALVEELIYCRRANVLLLRRLTSQAWNRQGIASGHPVTVRALAWMLAGHVIHHADIIHKRLNM